MRSLLVWYTMQYDILANSNNLKRRFSLSLNVSVFTRIDTDIIELKNLYIWLNALISRTTDPNWKNDLFLDSRFIEKCYNRL